jgi:hypothetical protein
MQRPSSPWPRTGTGRQSARRDALERTAALRLTSRRSAAQVDFPLSGRWQPAMAALKCLYVGAGDTRTDIHRSYRLNRSTTQSRGGVCHEQAYVLLHRRIRNNRAGRAGLRRDQGRCTTAGQLGSYDAAVLSKDNNGEIQRQQGREAGQTRRLDRAGGRRGRSDPLSAAGGGRSSVPGRPARGWAHGLGTWRTACRAATPKKWPASCSPARRR